MCIFVPAESTAIIQAGVTYLRIVAPFIAVVAVKQCCDGILQGASSAREFMATTFSDLVLQVGLAYILPLFMGYLGIWWAWPIGWFPGALLLLLLPQRKMEGSPPAGTGVNVYSVPGGLLRRWGRCPLLGLSGMHILISLIHNYNTAD